MNEPNYITQVVELGTTQVTVTISDGSLAEPEPMTELDAHDAKVLHENRKELLHDTQPKPPAADGLSERELQLIEWAYKAGENKNWNNVHHWLNAPEWESNKSGIKVKEALARHAPPQGERIAQLERECEWELIEEDNLIYSVQCGHMHHLDNGTLADNHHKFCPYCGGKIKEVGDERDN